MIDLINTSNFQNVIIITKSSSTIRLDAEKPQKKKRKKKEEEEMWVVTCEIPQQT
jgi:hypothetical protein